MQFEWMALVNQVEGASTDEFTSLAPAQLLTVQGTGIWAQLWKKTGHVLTPDCSFYAFTAGLQHVR